MDYVVGISWPRSGHHMVVRLLQLYFGSEFRYCNSYADDPTCCKSIPCLKAGEIHLSKSHDFKLEASQVKGVKYLIQYRQFAPSLTSNFELHVLHGGEDSARAFRVFASDKFGRYQDFLEKWVTSDFGAQQLVVEYGAFLKDPVEGLTRIVQYFDPDTAIDPDRLKQAIAEVDGERVADSKLTKLAGTGVHKNRNVTEFRYYTPELFNTLERLSLSADKVQEAFKALLGRPAKLDNILAFQAYANTADLEDFIRASAEYKARNPSGTL